MCEESRIDEARQDPSAPAVEEDAADSAEAPERDRDQDLWGV